MTIYPYVINNVEAVRVLGALGVLGELGGDTDLRKLQAACQHKIIVKAQCGYALNAKSRRVPGIRTGVWHP